MSCRLMTSTLASDNKLLALFVFIGCELLLRHSEAVGNIWTEPIRQITNNTLTTLV